MTDGPFYPSPSYRARALDWDADLTVVGGRDPDGHAAAARAPASTSTSTARSRTATAARSTAPTVEIWQCDVYGSYRHPRGAGARVDAGFQGFGSSRSDARGSYRFRTIRPVPYPGRTPHIHVKLRHPSFGELTSQLFVAGDPGNAATSSIAASSDDDREAVEMRPVRAPAGEPGDVAWSSAP